MFWAVRVVVFSLVIASSFSVANSQSEAPQNYATSIDCSAHFASTFTARKLGFKLGAVDLIDEKKIHTLSERQGALSAFFGQQTGATYEEYLNTLRSTIEQRQAYWSSLMVDGVLTDAAQLDFKSYFDFCENFQSGHERIWSAMVK